MRNVFTTFNKTRVYPNQWDAIAIILILSIIGLLVLTATGMARPYHIGQQMPIELNISYLPSYALHSVFRMLIALGVSLIFTFVIGAWAAKSRYAERILIPTIDVLQSVPVLGLLSITVIGFIKLFQGSLLGPECASIFAIFTAQAWNMTLGFYQSLKTVPKNLLEASHMFHLSAWQRFWRVEVPFAMPSLLWNTMMSMSASWFFVVASEAITVGGQHIALPGIGSYIAEALQHQNSTAIIAAIVTMLVVILLYDQILFRPLVAWGEKFKAQESSDETEEAQSWLLTLFQRSKIVSAIGDKIGLAAENIINFHFFKAEKTFLVPEKRTNPLNKFFHCLIIAIIAAVIIVSGIKLYGFIASMKKPLEILPVITLGSYTALRVFAVILFCTVFWVPIGIWIGLRPNVTKVAQPIIQFFAAFPAYLLYPIFVIIIVTYKLNPNIWTTPLFLLGTQWYVLFNIIAGTSALPNELHQVSDCFEVKGWTKWRRFILPGIFPYYITGVITAAGGAWNASIVAEFIVWGKKHVEAAGIGNFIKQATISGEFAQIMLGIAVLCLFVIIINRALWRPLYMIAQRRYQLD